MAFEADGDDQLLKACPAFIVQLQVKAGGIVTQVVAYSHRDVAHADASVMAKLNRNEIDWVTVTSNAIAHSIVKLFGASLRCTKLASLSPAISQTVADLGFSVSAVATETTMLSLIESIRIAESRSSHFDESQQ